MTIWRKNGNFCKKFQLLGTAATTLAGIYGALKVQGLPPSAIKDLVFVVCGAGSAASGVMLTIQNAMVRRYSTVWKFHDFSVTQILCEINSWESRSSEYAIFASLGALKVVDLV